LRFIIEFEGLITDIAPAHYRSHREAASAVGWSRLDAASFRRLTRTKGDDANFLPGAKPNKVEQYRARFAEWIESDDLFVETPMQDGVVERLRSLARFGACSPVTLGTNLEARRRAIDRFGISDAVERLAALSLDPRRRPTELRALAGDDPRALVVASTDVLIRSADAADLFTVGVSSGDCTGVRLHRAGARVVYPDLAALVASLRSGAGDLIDAGMLPPPIG
jgi:beta-phosphoglucomutase-like phosphatase (HAD superfamily)